MGKMQAKYCRKVKQPPRTSKGTGQLSFTHAFDPAVVLSHLRERVHVSNNRIQNILAKKYSRISRMFQTVLVEQQEGYDEV
jgi:hypothetical protein